MIMGEYPSSLPLLVASTFSSTSLQETTTNRVRYLPNLEPYKFDTSVKDRITLLASTQAEPGYTNLGFNLTRFASVFRTEPLGYGTRRQYSPPQTQPSINTYQYADARPILSPAASTFTPGSPPTNVYAPKPQANGIPTPTTSSLKTPSPAPSTGSVSWASVGGPAGSKNISIAPSKPTAPAARRYILYNAAGERIDEKLPKPDPGSRHKLDGRIQRGKLCNNWHLNGKCANGVNCNFGHEPPLSEGERNAFKQIVRKTKCGNGLECNNTSCYLGHQCPNPVCQRPDCFFEDLHGIDSVPTMRMYDDGEVDIIKGGEA